MPESLQKPGPATALARLIAAHASSAGARSGLVHAGRTWSYAELAMCARALALAMSADRLAGERVALMLPNGPEAVLAYLACFEAGAVATPLNSRYAPPEIEAVLRRARPRWIVAQADRLDGLDRVDPQVLNGSGSWWWAATDTSPWNRSCEESRSTRPRRRRRPTHRPSCSSPRVPRVPPRASSTAKSPRSRCSPVPRRRWAT